ncbi:cation transporter [Aeromicrobium choanae]|uniref:Predicted Co/Zn/Cd cation transporter, cation efflux family n=1 Tax=Aeromicrobium choanae TaxID=1736691 RepID=A0A1T4Z865_9ACTN|nr:cation transporter [Aeromicrobium choanae]SKB10164.1 Predicted Co/Zn/Cd cation transporter, cation efflux family [Aeromicrobium choanae]
MDTEVERERVSERRALRESIAYSAVLGTVAVLWGVLADSRVLLFDGVYTVLGILLSGLSLLAAVAAGAAPTRRFPYGKQAATPLAIGLQGAALLGTLLYAAADAVIVIRAGGADVGPGVVLSYGVLSALAALLVWWRLSRICDSELVGAERAQWKAGALLSAVIAVGGAVALGLDGTRWDAAVAYADPVLVLVACVLIAPVPYRLMRSAVMELLEAAPPADVQEAVAAAVQHARTEFGLPEPRIAATKLGGRLYLEVVFVVDGSWLVSDEDAVRRAIIERLASLPWDLWANVELTTEIGLAN